MYIVVGTFLAMMASAIYILDSKDWLGNPGPDKLKTLCENHSYEDLKIWMGKCYSMASDHNRKIISRKSLAFRIGLFFMAVQSVLVAVISIL